MVTEDMVTTDAGAHLGIVTTIDELQEALAPSDAPSPVTRPEGVFGYDDRDVDGRPLTSDPLGYSVNPMLNILLVTQKIIIQNSYIHVFKYTNHQD